MNEMGDEHHPLAGPRRGNDLSLLWSAVSNVGGEITHVLQLPDGALSDVGGLPFALGPRAGHDRIEGMAEGIFERETDLGDGAQRLRKAMAQGEVRAYR